MSEPKEHLTLTASEVQGDFQPFGRVTFTVEKVSPPTAREQRRKGYTAVTMYVPTRELNLARKSSEPPAQSRPRQGFDPRVADITERSADQPLPETHWRVQDARRAEQKKGG